ncbi:hypothetical protein [Enterococcus mundtii]|uniref:hypothetical protein n=1 Tax=Enterococcus mundtii TaxID=53346 RepID=UPI00321A2904
MINEYLFIQNDKADLVKELQFDIEPVISFPKNLEIEVSIIKYEIDKNNLTAAKKLSRIEQDILEIDDKLIILESGSSRYFNGILYPLVNDMERKLRKLLYLAAIHEKDSLTETIREIEQQDFGQIYKLLFVDSNFVSTTKEIAKNGIKGKFDGGTFTKSEIINAIDSLEEVGTWNKILNENAVPTLRSDFQLAREYRNDVMHAHNIDFEKFKKAKELYRTINSELDKEINKISISPVNELLLEAGISIKDKIKQVNLNNLISSKNTNSVKDLVKITEIDLEKLFEGILENYLIDKNL